VPAHAQHGVVPGGRPGSRDEPAGERLRVHPVGRADPQDRLVRADHQVGVPGGEPVEVVAGGIGDVGVDGALPQPGHRVPADDAEQAQLADDRAGQSGRPSREAGPGRADQAAMGRRGGERDVEAGRPPGGAAPARVVVGDEDGPVRMPLRRLVGDRGADDTAADDDEVVMVLRRRPAS
jgi:hypothetical protein